MAHVAIRSNWLRQTFYSVAVRTNPAMSSVYLQSRVLTFPFEAHVISVGEDDITGDVGALEVPVDGAEHLLALLVGPVGREQEGDQRQLAVQNDEQRRGHVVPDVVPVAVTDAPHHHLGYVAQVEGVDEKELVGLPEKGTFLAGLEKDPAEGREGCGHLDDQPLAGQLVGPFCQQSCRHKQRDRDRD